MYRSVKIVSAALSSRAVTRSSLLYASPLSIFLSPPTLSPPSAPLSGFSKCNFSRHYVTLSHPKAIIAPTQTSFDKNGMEAEQINMTKKKPASGTKEKEDGAMKGDSYTMATVRVVPDEVQLKEQPTIIDPLDYDDVVDEESSDDEDLILSKEEMAGSGSGAEVEAAGAEEPTGRDGKQRVKSRGVQKGADDFAEKDAKVDFESVWNAIEAEVGRENMLYPKEIIWLMGAPGAGKGTNVPFIMDERGITAEAIEISQLLDFDPLCRERKVCTRGDMKG